MHFLKKIPLFCSSYSPLIIIALLLKVNFHNLACWKLVALAVIIGLICVGYYFLYKDIKQPSSGIEDHTILSVENRNDMMHTYLLPYLIFILSFFTPSLLKQTQLLALIIFSLILFFVYIRSDLFLFDIFVIIFGYNYYKVISKTNAFVVISNVNLYEKINMELSFKLIDANIFKYEE